MVFSQGRKETILKKTEKKGCWKRLGRVASQQMDCPKFAKSYKIVLEKN